MNQFPPSPRVLHRSASNFFKNSRRYLQVKVHHWYQCHRCQWHWPQIFPLVSLVLLIPVANLPPVSTIPAANNGNNYQTADNFKWTWKKFLLYGNYTIQRCPKEIKKNFRLKIFSICLHHDLRICPRIFETWGKLIHEKNRSNNSRDAVPLNTHWILDSGAVQQTHSSRCIK